MSKLIVPDTAIQDDEIARIAFNNFTSMAFSIYVENVGRYMSDSTILSQKSLSNLAKNAFEAANIFMQVGSMVSESMLGENNEA